MRRILPIFVGCLFIVATASAQRGGGGHGGGGGARGGGGGGFHGGGIARGSVGNAGAFRGGNFGGFRGGTFNRGRFGFRGYSTFGYGYPFYGAYWWNPFLWDWWDDGYQEPYPYYPEQYPYEGGYGAGTPPVVIISNGYPAVPPAAPPAPVVREYPPPSATPAPQASSKYEEPLYLLAFHDGVIRAVLAYWVQGTTVHYVTMDNKEAQTPLSSLDRDLSQRLNRERNVTFSLPG